MGAVRHLSGPATVKRVGLRLRPILRDNGGAHVFETGETGVAEIEGHGNQRRLTHGIELRPNRRVKPTGAGLGALNVIIEIGLHHARAEAEAVLRQPPRQLIVAPLASSAIDQMANTDGPIAQMVLIKLLAHALVTADELTQKPVCHGLSFRVENPHKIGVFGLQSAASLFITTGGEVAEWLKARPC